MSEWDLLEDPMTAQLPVTDPDDPGSAQFNIGTFIGKTIIRPLSREQKIDWVSATGARLVASAIGQILGTRCDSEFAGGELPWRTEFGSKVYRLRNKLNSPAMLEIARRYIIDAITNWAPWVRITKIRLARQSSTGGGENILAARIYYDLVDENSSSNQVLVSDLDTVVELE